MDISLRAKSMGKAAERQGGGPFVFLIANPRHETSHRTISVPQASVSSNKEPTRSATSDS
jgi:hypothetical protein